MSTTTRTVAVRLSMDVSDLIAKSKAGGQALVDMASKGEKASARQAAAMQQVGSAAGKVGLVAAVGLGAAVMKAADFDQAMSNVQAATHESTGNMERLREAALQAGQDTVYSATESAGAIEELAKAGVSTSDILGGGLSGALDLAAAGGMEVARAAETAASAMTQFGLGGDDVTHIADLLAAGAGKAQGSVDDLGMALNQSGLVAAQTGLSIEEATAGLAAFASAGLTGSDAGTSFKTMLLSLNPRSTEAANLMDSLGISAYDAQGNFIGLENYAGRLQGALSGMSAEQRNATLTTIFGTDAVRAANVLYKQGADGIASWTAKVNDQGYAAETAATRLDNLKGDLEQLGGAFETALIGSGDGSQGALRSMTQGVTSVVNAYNELPAAGKNAASGLLAVTAVTGGAAWLGSKVVRGIADTRDALDALGITAGTTKARLASMASGGAAAAVGVGTLLDTLDRMDSISRNSAASDATVKSYQDLAEALEFSNVGKYADDLHFDLTRLTDDLYENGSEGEYVTKVMGDLTEKSHGFGAMLNSQASNIIPGWTGAADKAYDTRKNLQDIIENNTDALGKGSKAADADAEALDALGASTEQLAAVSQTSAAEMQSLQDAVVQSREQAAESAASFNMLGESLNDSKVSLGDWIGDMRETAIAIEEFTANSLKAAKKGLDEGLITSLQDAGTEGALRMKELANASDKELDRANKAWRRGVRAQEDFVDSAVNVRNAEANLASGAETLAQSLRSLPKKVITDVRANGIPKTDADLSALQKKYKLTPDQVQTIAKLRDMAGPQLKALFSEVDKLDRAKANPKVTANAGQALSSAAAVKASLDSIKSKSVTITTTYETNYSGKPRVPLAAGGFLEGELRAYAAGDVADGHEPEFAGPGVTRIWREPETGGESYIPHANDWRRPRAKAITEQTAAKFGGRVEWYAGGGTTAANYAMSTSLIQRFAGGGTSGDKKKQKKLKFSLENEGEPEIYQSFNWIDKQMGKLEKSMQGFGRELGAAMRELDGLETELKNNEEALRDEESTRDSLISKMEDLGNAVADKFSSDLFAKDEKSDRNIWAAPEEGGGAADWRSRLMADTEDAQEETALIGQLKAAGATGTALEYLLRNADSEQQKQMLAAGEVDDFATMFGQREDALTQLAEAAGRSVYGEQVDASVAAVQRLEGVVESLKTQITDAEGRRWKAEQELEARQQQWEQYKEQAAEARSSRQADRTGAAVGDAVNGAMQRGLQQSKGKR